MLAIKNYEEFVIAIVIFQLIPGPGTLSILTSTATAGIRAGACAVIGILSGDLLYMCAAVAGVATVMKASPVLFSGLQWIGIVYLGWIGLQVAGAGSLDADGHSDFVPSTWFHLRRSLKVSLTNMKAILFFTSFFPPFLPKGASLALLAAMVAHVLVIGAFYQTILVCAGHWAASILKPLPHMQIVSRRLAGLVIASFAIMLAFEKR